MVDRPAGHPKNIKQLWWAHGPRQVPTSQVVGPSTQGRPTECGWSAHGCSKGACAPEGPAPSFLDFCPRRPRATAEAQPIPRMLLLYLLCLVVQSGHFQIEQAKAQGQGPDGNHLQQPTSRNMRAASAIFKKGNALRRNQSDFWVLSARIPHSYSLQILAFSSPSDGPVLVSQMSGADLFHGYGSLDFQCRQIYFNISVLISQIFPYHEFRQFEIPVPGASMAVNTLLIGLSQLLHDDFTSASDSFVDWRPKDLFVGTTCTLQSMGYSMRLQS